MPASSGLAKPLKTTYRRFGRASAQDLSMIGRILNWAKGTGNIILRLNPTGMVVDGSRLIAYSEIPFGYEILPNAQVKIKAGKIYWAEDAPYAVAEKTLTITEDNSYVYVEILLNAGAVASVTMMQPSTTEPVNAPGYRRRWFWLFGLTDAGQVYRKATGCMGNQYFDGTYGKP